ncbi:MAG: GTP-binding protein [Leptolyngbyaceae cyanobacterium MO_188.B28]|nr:GTP-binding protein [Leptolyngbyaceae cyanobacterium MO_188.B28]
MSLTSDSPANDQAPASQETAEFNFQTSHLNRTRSSLKRAIARYTPKLRLSFRSSDELQRQAEVKAGLDELSTLLKKLDSSVLRVAVFGLVSRGKSAVLNGLVGEKLLQTGPLHGVTQWPRSIYWTPEAESSDDSPAMQFELIDTPGLDEIEGQERAEMAQAIAQQADLILFVVAGDITRTEYRALRELRQTQKPLLLVFNKIDLYPDRDRQAIHENLQALWRQSGESLSGASPLLSTEDIVMVAAEPAPLQVRVEWPDGRVTDEWESPPAQIDELKQALLDIAQREGQSLLALNALRQATEVEGAIARNALDLHRAEAEDLIWRFAKYKGLIVALNPIAILDLAGGAFADLVMIRSLARLYDLPMTGYEASRLWRAIMFSSGAVLLSEMGSGLLLGMGKSAAAAASFFDSASSLMVYAGTMTAQAAAAGYGAYTVGQAARVYLEQGCTWGPQGVNTVMKDILTQATPDSTIYRLREELGEILKGESDIV